MLLFCWESERDSIDWSHFNPNPVEWKCTYIYICMFVQTIKLSPLVDQLESWSKGPASSSAQPKRARIKDRFGVYVRSENICVRGSLFMRSMHNGLLRRLKATAHTFIHTPHIYIYILFLYLFLFTAYVQDETTTAGCFVVGPIVKYLCLWKRSYSVICIWIRWWLRTPRGVVLEGQQTVRRGSYSWSTVSSR